MADPLLVPHHESYEAFCRNWIDAQEQMMKEMSEAIEGDTREAELAQMVSKVEHHYEAYYSAKDTARQQDILLAMVPAWKSPLETAFMWLGGWRPSLAFQLLYALAGQQILAELQDLLDGVDTPSLASLSSSQLSQVSELQMATMKEEDKLEQQMAELQQSFADHPLLTLAQMEHVTSQGSSTVTSEESSSSSTLTKDIENAIAQKLEGLQDISVKADSVRLNTFRKMLNLLDTYQKAQYLVAAAKLQVTLRKVRHKLSTIADINAERAC